MMKPMFDNGFAVLYHADARQLPIPDNSVDCVVTSPPYWGLRDYGLDEQGLGLEPTPEEYCANMVEVFREVWRVLKPTGTLWVNLGDSYAGSTTLGRNDVDRKYPGSIGKGLEASAGSRQMPSGLKPKDLVGIPWRVAFALQADGWYLRSDIIWSKSNPMPESVTDRPTKAHEYVFLLTKSQRYYYDADAIRENLEGITRLANSFRDGGVYTQGRSYNNSGETGKATHGDTEHMGVGRNKRTVWEISTQPYPEAHFATFPEKLVEPCILAGTSEKGVCAECGKPWERIMEVSGGTIGTAWHDHTDDLTRGMRDNSNGKSTDGTYNREHKGWQPTCECNAETIPATVLDPFAGSGTTLAVAQRLGRKGIGTDLNAEYIHLAIERLSQISLPMLLV